MSPNSNSEFKIPVGDHNPEYPTPISEGVGEIYAKIGNIITPAYFQSQSERSKNPISENILKIGYEMSQARKSKIESQSSQYSANKRKFIESVAGRLFHRDVSYKLMTEDDLKAQESKIGGEIFGQCEEGVTRAFWNDDTMNWYFHQRTSIAGVIDDMTLHYEINPTGILMICNKVDVPNNFINGQELENFVSATNIYRERVMRQIYSNDTLQLLDEDLGKNNPLFN